MRGKMFLAVQLVFLFVLCGCVTTGGPGSASDAVQLQVSFADPAWDGKMVPAGQQCNRFGGSGSTPALMVRNIPAEADAIIMEFSDRDVPQMNNGGHGKIGFTLKPGTAEVMVPPVPGHTFDLPEGFFVVAPHRNPSWDKAGAYMPPCSGGRGNLYYVTVKAVQLPASKGQKEKVLCTARMNLGRY